MQAFLFLIYACSHICSKTAIAISTPGIHDRPTLFGKNGKAKGNNGEINRHIVKPKPSRARGRKSHSNDCDAFDEYKRLKATEDKAPPVDWVSVSKELRSKVGESGLPFKCINYDTCLQAHLDNLQAYGLSQRCAITDDITDMPDRRITFTHVIISYHGGYYTTVV
jgi:hypothetical protein